MTETTVEPTETTEATEATETTKKPKKAAKQAAPKNARELYETALGKLRDAPDGLAYCAHKHCQKPVKVRIKTALEAHIASHAG